MHYPDYVARFYDVLYAQLRTVDHQYYLEKIRQTKGPVLEIGVGTGRFFIEAFKQGADIYGIDASNTMLNVLRQRLEPAEHLRVSNQLAQEFTFNKKFDLIISPFRVFSHLISVESQLSALERISEHLTETGKFIFDLFVPDLEKLSTGIIDHVDFDGEHEPGKKLKRISSAHADPIEQVNLVTMRYEWEEDVEMKSDSWNFKMRYFFRWELEHLIARSPLKLETIHGDYFEGILNNDSKDFVVVCSKK